LAREWAELDSACASPQADASRLIPQLDEFITKAVGTEFAFKACDVKSVIEKVQLLLELARSGRFSEALTRLGEYEQVIASSASLSRYLETLKATRSAIIAEVDDSFQKLRDRALALLTKSKFDEADAVVCEVGEWKIAELDVQVQQLSSQIRKARESAASRPLTKPQPPVVAQPPSADFERARKRLAEAVELLKKEREEAGRRLEARKRLLIDQTGKNPLELKLSDSLVLSGCKVTDYKEDAIHIKSPQVEMTIPMGALPPTAAHEVLTLTLAPDDADGYYQLGRFCALNRLFREADSAFKKAMKLDSSIAPKVPDLKVLQQPPRMVHGKFSNPGWGIIRVAYEFSSKEELQDFESASARLDGAQGVMEITGKNLFLVQLKEIAFVDSIAMMVRPCGSKEADSAPCFGMAFQMASGREIFFLAVVLPETNCVRVLKVDGEDAEIVADDIQFRSSSSRPAGGSKLPVLGEIEFRMRSGNFQMFCDRRMFWQAPLGQFAECAVVLGGIAAPGATGTVHFDALTVEGRVIERWLKKSILEVQARIRRELEEDLKTGSLEVKPKLPRLAIEENVDALSLNEEAYEEARKWLEKYFETGEIKDLQTSSELFEAIVRRAPAFAGGFYWKGCVCGMLGKRADALDMFTKVIELEPHKPDGYIARSNVHIGMFAYAKASEDILCAIEKSPDCADAYAMRGMLTFFTTRSTEALDDLDLAVILNPDEASNRDARKCIRHVLRGPAWQKRYEKTSAHYVVATDISRARADFYGKHLDLMRTFYAKQFNVDPAAVPKGEVLIFQTQEGYFTYAELSTDDRAENTLGYYHPFYRQLMLFEDLDMDETLHVLNHEAFHQFIHALIPAIPIWLNEGMAEYFGATTVEKDKIAKTAIVLEGRLATLKWALEYGWTPVPFKQIMLEGQREFYSATPTLKYAQAWSMVHFMREKEKTRYGPILESYVTMLREGKTPEEAFAATFEKADLARMQSEWLAYIKELKE
ncbi:MAG: DUF1570 domain-containing protein, partial [Planctomycetota bacterium]|nr:DUF1570 domain-containing protein [Planctomycetota bacterium]